MRLPALALKTATDSFDFFFAAAIPWSPQRDALLIFGEKDVPPAYQMQP
jgi:hypothetical protein